MGSVLRFMIFCELLLNSGVFVTFYPIVLLRCYVVVPNAVRSVRLYTKEKSEKKTMNACSRRVGGLFATEIQIKLKCIDLSYRQFPYLDDH